MFFKSRILFNPPVYYLQQARVGGAPQACGDRKNVVPLLRAYSADGSDHFYTTDAAEMENAVTKLGYNSEGTTGFIFPT